MDLDGLVYDRPDLGKFRVHRSGMVLPEIYELERQRIFDRCWLYLGHETEVPNPGDYARRVVAERPLFFTRDRDGQLQVFHNTCPHRGALICRTDHGNAQVLQCFYHAWSFNTSGELIGMPDIEGYGPDFDRSEMSLRSPRFDSYQGFIFVCFDQETEPLVDYLAGSAEYLDLIADQAPEGMRVIRVPTATRSRPTGSCWPRTALTAITPCPHTRPILTTWQTRRAARSHPSIAGGVSDGPWAMVMA